MKFDLQFQLQLGRSQPTSVKFVRSAVPLGCEAAASPQPAADHAKDRHSGPDRFKSPV
jgi:hypothetical protein